MSTSTWAFNENDTTKLYDLAAKQSPQLAKTIKSVNDFFSPTGVLPTTLQGIQGGIESAASTLNGVPAIDDVNPEVYRRLRYQYSNLYIATAAGLGTSAIGGVQDTLVTTVSSASLKLQETLKPISSFMGSTLGNLTGVLKDPIGSAFAVPGTLGAMMAETNPALAAKYEATFKKYNIDKLAELPQNMFGSVQQIFKTIDMGLAVPINFITDVYYGAMDILKQLNDFVNSIFSLLQQIFNNIIRTLLPGLTEFLTALADFANQISGIASIFSGISQITQYTSLLQTYSNKLNGFIQSPGDYLQTFIPQSVSNGLYVLRNPQTLLNQFVPPEIANNFKMIQDITGLGFNGRMGFGLESVLRGFQGGVLSTIMEGFATQFAILSPLFTGRSIQPPSEYPNSTQILRTPGGDQYNIDKTTGQVVRIRRPEPVFKGKE
jgi:hypothetical protein